MTENPGQAVEKIHRDHDYLFELMQRIRSVCGVRNVQADCRTCGSDLRVVCQGNIHQLVQTFVEATLKHHVVESLYMVDAVPPEHRVPHIRAHMAIAEQLKNIRVVFSEDGNCVKAVEGIENVFAAIQAHIEEFDAPMAQYLAQPA